MAKELSKTITLTANISPTSPELAKKQDKLTAGANITIKDNVISASSTPEKWKQVGTYQNPTNTKYDFTSVAGTTTYRAIVAYRGNAGCLRQVYFMVNPQNIFSQRMAIDSFIDDVGTCMLYLPDNQSISIETITGDTGGAFLARLEMLTT